MSEAIYKTRVINTRDLPETALALVQMLAGPAQAIQRGELVAFPTETVYGLGASAFMPEAISKIYEVKGRPQDNPLIVHLADLKDLEQVAQDIPDIAYELFKAFSPGPLTLILPKSDCIPYEATAGLDTVGIRFPKTATSRALIRAAGPLVAPSANLSGRPSPTRAEHVLSDLDGKIPYILDGGNCQIGLESTILDLTQDPPQILRPGGLTQETLEAFLAEKLTRFQAKPGVTGPAKAPGMKYRHYAPKALVTVYQQENQKQAFADWIEASSDKRIGLFLSDREAEEFSGYLTSRLGEEAASHKLAHLSFIPTEGEVNPAFQKPILLYSYQGVTEAAHDLFAAFRFYDEQGVSQIFVQGEEVSGAGQAYMNRLSKAAGGEAKPLEVYKHH